MTGASAGISNEQNNTSGTKAFVLLQYLQGYKLPTFGNDFIYASGKWYYNKIIIIIKVLNK